MTDPQDSHRSTAGTSVEEEARRLMESLGAWAAGQTTGERQTHAAEPESATQTEQPRTTDGAGCSCNPAPRICRVCPVCRVGAVVESLSPELVDHLADLVAMVAGSLKAVAEDRRAARTSADAAAEPTGHDRGPERQHVPKDDSAFGADDEDEGEQRP